jgi:hypothetical protein
MKMGGKMVTGGKITWTGLSFSFGWHRMPAFSWRHIGSPRLPVEFSHTCTF